MMTLRSMTADICRRAHGSKTDAHSRLFHEHVHLTTRSAAHGSTRKWIIEVDFLSYEFTDQKIIQSFETFFVFHDLPIKADYIDFSFHKRSSGLDDSSRSFGLGVNWSERAEKN